MTSVTNTTGAETIWSRSSMTKERAADELLRRMDAAKNLIAQADRAQEPTARRLKAHCRRRARSPEKSSTTFESKHSVLLMHHRRLLQKAGAMFISEAEMKWNDLSPKFPPVL